MRDCTLIRECYRMYLDYRAGFLYLSFCMIVVGMLIGILLNGG